jgi:hypothetical protein
VLNGGEGFTREISIANPTGTYYARLASADRIENRNGLYIIDDKSYYIKVEETGSAKAIIRTAGGRKELLVPVLQTLRYSIIF